MSTDLAVRAPELDRLARLGQWLAASESGSTDPKALGAAAAYRLAIIQELGLPLAAAATVSLIKGRLKMQSQLKRAIVEKQGLFVLRDEEASDDKTCTAVLIVKETGEELGRMTFTIEMARRAKLVKPDSNWEKYPERMLWARASGYVIDDFAPAYSLGIVGDVDEDETIDGEVVEELGGDPGAEGVAAGMGPPSPPDPVPGGAELPPSPADEEPVPVMESTASEDAEPRPDNKPRPTQKLLTKLDITVEEMRKAGQITTAQVAELAGLQPTLITDQAGTPRWSQLRLLLTADQASRLLSELGFWSYKHPPADTEERGQTEFAIPDKAKK